MNPIPLSGFYENWHQWHRVQHGQGCVQSLSSELDQLNIRRPFLISTRSLVKEASILARVREAAGRPFAGEFTAASAHSPRDNVLAAVKLARQAKPDGFVCFGGSSVVDTCKATTLALAVGIRALEDFDKWVSPKGRETELNGRLLPQIAIPTTLSAAEYGRDIGITDTQRRVKHLYRYDAVVPQSILLDPDLAAATPPRLWSATGIKMMSDAVELIYSKRSHPVLEPLCLQAVRWFAAYLPRSFDENQVVAVDARMHCQLAAWMTLFGTHNAGTCTALGAALRHQLGGALGMPHGEATCIMLPHLVLFNASAVPDGYQRLAEALDVHVPGQTRDERVQAVAGRIRRLAQELGMPSRLSDLGATAADLAHIAHHALEEPAADFNPRTVRDEQELITLLEAAL